MSWASIILTALKLVLAGLQWAQSRQLIKAGEDAAIGRAAVEVAKRTEEGRRLFAAVQALSDEAQAKLLKDLEV